MASRTTSLSGKIPKLKDSDAKRLAAYLLRGNDVVAQAPLQGDGSFRITLPRTALASKSAYALRVAIAPAGAGDHLEHVPNVQQVQINRAELEKSEKDFVVPVERLAISDAILKIWWRWCRQYCITGAVIGPNGCPVPAADVTVYSVGYTGSGYSKVPRVTVTTGTDGTFTACFEWCVCPFCFCWPCWPFWWDCFPWWWEYDILHVIRAIEQRPPIPGPGPVETRTGNVNLFRPQGNALVRGQGFPEAFKAGIVPDESRTALIKSKLKQASIRAIFPWWWWCCDDPNIVFSVNQGGTILLDENPATDTRWCFEDGSSVTLTTNNQAITACSPGPIVESGFAWTRVGSVLVDHIDQGYAEWWGGDSNDAAFAGSLDIYGGFAPGTPVACYQVEAGQWTGNPARGGTAPGSSSPISADLYNYVFIFDGTATLVFAGWIKMGPFTGGAVPNLYATEEARQSGPTPPGLSAFPAVPAGGFVLWAYRERKVYAASSALIGGNPSGSVDLTLVGYDTGFNPVALTPDAPLTLTIDNTGLTHAKINSVLAFRADGTVPPLTGTGDCPAYDIGPGGYVQVNVTVSDANGHLDEYNVSAEHGHGHTDLVTPPGTRGYVTNPLVSFGDPNYAQKSWIGGSEVMTYYPPVDCCYEFRIRASKRATDGYSGPSLSDYDFQTISLKV